MSISKNPETLWRRYALAISAILILISASHFMALDATSSGEENAAAVNISGRQRMLSQRIMFFAAEKMQASDASTAPIDNLVAAINLFERSHKALVYGGDLGLSGTLSDELRQLYFGPDGASAPGAVSQPPLNQQVETFIANARAIAGQSVGAAGTAYDAMRKVGPSSLLRDLNHAVSGFENQAKADVTRSRFVANVGFVLALLVLFLEALLIFLPAHRMIVTAFGALKEKTDSLEVSEAQAKRLQAEAETARDQAEHANEVKANFIANMSHEIRTPLNAVIGFSNLCMKTDLDEQQEDYVQKIQASSSVLLSLVNDILDMSKIDADKVELEAIDFDLSDVLANTTTILSARAAEKGLELLIDIDPNVPVELIGDPLRLGQVLVNLASNAVKFTEVGEVIIYVALEEMAEDDLTLKFSIQDTGIGMSKAQIDKLFQPFVQADASMTRRYGGTGLGLTISRRLVELMGGIVSAESEPGQGSCFTFTAKFRLAANGGYRQLVPEEHLRGARILIVDDNAMALQILQETLETLSFDVTALTSSEEATKAVIFQDASGKPFDLVILDWKMPHMSGLETAGAIRHLDDLSSIPGFIILTAFSVEDLKSRDTEKIVDGYMTKPVNQSLLYDIITRILMRRQGNAEGKVGGDVGDRVKGAGTIAPRSRRTEKPTVARQNVRGAHLLIAEDNTLNQQILCEILNSNAMTFDVASTGVQAVDIMKDRGAGFDAVLMDLQMPEMDGLTATRTIRALPEYTDVPIIAMTAHTMSGDREKCLEAGMVDHIPKPLDPDRMFATIARWVDISDDRLNAATAAVSAREKGLLDKKIADSPTVSAPLLPTGIYGLDMDQGLRIVGGNAEMYATLLKDFAHQFHGAGAELQMLIDDDRLDEAARLAHSLKGVSGNLGATDLFTASVTLETALTTSPDTSGAAVKAFQVALANITGPLLTAFGASAEQIPGRAPDHRNAGTASRNSTADSPMAQEAISATEVHTVTAIPPEHSGDELREEIYAILSDITAGNTDVRARLAGLEPFIDSEGKAILSAATHAISAGNSSQAAALLKAYAETRS